MESKRHLREYCRVGPSYTNPGYAVTRRSAWYIRDRAEKHLGGRLLEIGCGDKRMQVLLGDLVDEYVGLDHPSTIHSRSVVDIMASAYETTVPDRSFDCVLCTAVLEHLERPEDALREALRVLKPGGCALYTCPLFWHLHEEPRDFFRYTRHGLRHLFEAVGFEIVEITPMSSFWLTFGSAWGYYLQKYRKGLLTPALDGGWEQRCSRSRSRPPAGRALRGCGVVVARRPNLPRARRKLRRLAWGREEPQGKGTTEYPEGTERRGETNE
jgi:SAM-dependent methyltransferase